MSQTNKTIKIIIADDNELFRIGFGLMLKQNPRFNILGEAEDGEQLVQLAKKHKPDIVITDIQMPNMDGISATKILKQHFPKIQIIALSIFGQESSIGKMLDAGALGYLEKTADHAEVMAAIEAVHNGQKYFCKSCERNLIQKYAANNKREDHVEFTCKELEVLKLICAELTNVQISKKLNIGKRTVETHRKNILIKTDSINTAGIVKYAIRNKLIED